MGKVIGRIDKHSNWNWPYTSPKTTLVIPHYPEPSIKTQSTSACAASVGAHYLAYFILDQSKSHHFNTDVNNNDDSQSFETPRKNVYQIYLFW